MTACGRRRSWSSFSGIAALGVIPAVDASMEEALRDPRSSLSEAHRSLGTALQFSTESGLPQIHLDYKLRPRRG